MAAAAPVDGFTRSPTPMIVAFTAAMIAVCVGLVVQGELNLGNASVESVLRSGAELSPQVLLGLRCVFAVVILHALIARMRAPATIVTPLRNPLSRTPPATITMRGWVIFSTFTVQSWTLQLVYFMGTSLLGASRMLGAAPTGSAATVIAALLWIAFEVSFTVSILVSAVTTYVLIPKTLRSGQVPTNFFGWPQQAMHNLNVVFMGEREEDTGAIKNNRPARAPTARPAEATPGAGRVLFSGRERPNASLGASRACRLFG
jgi:hypothetical protein